MNPNGRPENLKPCKPGETANPNGRPKGVRDRRTVLKEILAQIKEGKDIDGHTSQKDLEYWIVLKKVHNALSGKSNDINDIMDWIYGKQEEKTELSTKDDKPIVLFGVKEITNNA